VVNVITKITKSSIVAVYTTRNYAVATISNDNDMPTILNNDDVSVAVDAHDTYIDDLYKEFTFSKI
jgi:hypothetical protein